MVFNNNLDGIRGFDFYNQYLQETYIPFISHALNIINKIIVLRLHEI